MLLNRIKIWCWASALRYSNIYLNISLLNTRLGFLCQIIYISSNFKYFNNNSMSTDRSTLPVGQMGLTTNSNLWRFNEKSLQMSKISTSEPI